MTAPCPQTIRDALRIVEERFPVRERVQAEVATAEKELNERKHELRNKRLFRGSEFSQAESTKAVEVASEKHRSLLTQRREANSSCADALRKLWDATTAALVVLEQLNPQRAAQRRVLLGELGEMTRLQGDFPPNTVDRLHNVNDDVFQPWELEHMKRLTVTRAERVLTAWKNVAETSSLSR